MTYDDPWIVIHDLTTIDGSTTLPPMQVVYRQYTVTERGAAPEMVGVTWRSTPKSKFRFALVWRWDMIASASPLTKKASEQGSRFGLDS